MPLKISEWHCRINLALLCPLRHCRKLSTLFSIQQIGSQNCSSAYERLSILKSHEYCSRKKKSSWGKRNSSLSSQEPDLLIPSNYPLIFLKNSSIYHRDWHQHKLQCQADSLATWKGISETKGLMVVVVLLRICVPCKPLGFSSSEGDKFLMFTHQSP